jgi:hypothetical protein
MYVKRATYKQFSSTTSPHHQQIFMSLAVMPIVRKADDRGRVNLKTEITHQKLNLVPTSKILELRLPLILPVRLLPFTSPFTCVDTGVLR